MEATHPRPFHFGVIGFGKIARTRFVPSLASIPTVQLTAVGTRTPERLADERFPSPAPQILPYDELIRQGRNLVDAVYIALPNDLHEQWVLRSAEAGLHVLCEKPLTRTYASAMRCRQTCLERGVLLAEGFMYRHDPRHLFGVN